LTRAVVKTPDGFLLLNPADFPADFAADLPRAEAEFEARAQMPASATVFTAEIPDPAWKTKPSWYMVAKADRIINPDLERLYAKRAHSHTVEIDGASHSVYESHPQEVAALIEQAAQHGAD
jgi:pimeloyl-ACP methyl ester carboxylesterase